MGNPTSELVTFSKIQRLINSSRFNESFMLLKNQMKPFPSLAKEMEILYNSENTYRYMLDYISEGHNDPSHKDMIEQIRDALFYANDLLLREARLKDSSDLYSSTKRMFVLRQSSFLSLLEDFDNLEDEILKDDPENSSGLITPARSRVLNELFNYVWTLFGSSPEDYEAIGKFLNDAERPEYIKAMSVSAIVLGNLSYFNPESFELLLNQLDNTDSLVLKARLLTGIILISLVHSKRIVGNIKIRSRLMLAAEDPDFKKNVNDLLLSIIRTYDTQRIDNKMRNEVIPGLMKINPEIIDKMRNLASDSDNFLSGGNPEWEELIENSEIGDKLKEISDMQLEGADVMVTAFSKLKGFPFFYQAANWFLPFTPGNYEFESLALGNDKDIVERLTTVMCDSDLHSFLLSLKSMPEDRRNMMFSNMNNQMKEAYEAMNNSVGDSEDKKLSRKIRHSLQDLYRFFKFYRKKEDFSDPFAAPFIDVQIEPLINILGFEINNITLVAEFYFKNKYYDEAAGIFELIDRINPGDFNIWEKIGFAHDRMRRFDKAVDWYSKADLVNPGNAWLEKKLAIALKNANKTKEAIAYYQKALKNDPENYHLLMSAGQCYLSLGNNSEALQHFYHAQYLKPDKLDAQRAIAWAELISGNQEKAKVQYEKILGDNNSDKTDYLNAAHSALARNDFKKALDFYKIFVEKNDNKDITSLVLAFKEDAEALKQLGIKTADLRLIVDKIRYDINNQFS